MQRSGTTTEAVPLIKAFGEFRGGAFSVWLEDDKCANLKALPNDKLVALDISRT